MSVSQGKLIEWKCVLPFGIEFHILSKCILWDFTYLIIYCRYIVYLSVQISVTHTRKCYDSSVRWKQLECNWDNAERNNNNILKSAHLGVNLQQIAFMKYDKSVF
jgi:hypothetical protein